MNLTKNEILALNNLFNNLDCVNDTIKSVKEKTDIYVQRINEKSHNILFMLGAIDEDECDINEILNHDDLKKYDFIDKLKYNDDFKLVKFDYYTYITNIEELKNPYNDYISFTIEEFYKENSIEEDDDEVYSIINYIEKDDNTVWFNFSNHKYNKIEGEVVDLRDTVEKFNL